MANEFYTLIVVPHARARFRKFQVSVRLTRWVLAAFGVMALSDIPLLKAIGSTVALGALLALLLAAMLHRPGVTMPQGQDNDADDHRYRA